MRVVTSLSILAVAALVTGCNTTARMQIPEARKAEAIEVSVTDDLKPIAFQKAIAAIRRGTVIAHFPGMANAGFDATLCNKNYASDAKLEWSIGTSHLSGWSDELGEVFYDTMKAAGYNDGGRSQGPVRE